MNKAEKWNFEKQEYEEYELLDNCPLICYDMEKIINCADYFDTENVIVVKQSIIKMASVIQYAKNAIKRN